MRPVSLQARVLLLVLLPGTAIALLLSGYFLHARFGDLEHAHLERGRALARQLAPAAQYGLFAGDRDELARLANAVLHEPDVVAVSIRDAQEAVLATSRHPAYANDAQRNGYGDGSAISATAVPVHAESASVLPRDARSSGSIDNAALIDIKAFHETAPDPLRRAFVAPVVNTPLRLEPYFDHAPAERRLGSVTVEMSLANLELWKRQQFAYSAGVALVILLISSLAAIRLGRGLTRPIGALSRTVSAIAHGDFSMRAEETSRGELLTLERGINHMAAALRDSHRDLHRRIAEATAELEARKEQAELSSASKTRFLAAASHDLRQPMQALGLWVSALRLQARDPALADMSAKIETSVNVLGEMLNALLDISRLDAGAVRPVPRPVPVDQLFDRLILQFEAQANAKGLHLSARRSGLSVRSDPVLLTRILHNLTANAIKYTAAGRILLCARRRGDRVRIEVRDSGPGISADRQTLVFEEFYQLDNPERDREKGLGLGLAIVQRLTRLLDHGCDLRSAPGRGSTFAITAPRERTVASPRATARPEKGLDLERLRCRRVAVLDDDPLIRASLADLLRGLGCEVTIAGTLRELEAGLAGSASPFELFICDYRLAEGDNGVDAINRVRAAIGPKLPCLLISGDLDPDLSRLARSAGVLLLRKPVQARRLARTMLDLLR